MLNTKLSVYYYYCLPAKRPALPPMGLFDGWAEMEGCFLEWGAWDGGGCDGEELIGGT